MTKIKQIEKKNPTFWISLLFSDEMQFSLLFSQLSISMSTLSSPVFFLSFLRLLLSDDGLLSDLILTLSSARRFSSDTMYLEPRQQKLLNIRFISKSDNKIDWTRKIGDLKQKLKILWNCFTIDNYKMYFKLEK